MDQEILARLAGQYGIPYDDDMDEDAYYDNECFWEMVILQNQMNSLRQSRRF